MSKKQRIRYDRIAAVLGIFILLIVLLVSCAKGCSGDKKDKSAKKDAPAVTTTATVVTTTAPVTVAHTDNVQMPGMPSSTACAVYMADYDMMLYEYHIDERVAPASLTKLLTASAALKYASSNETFTVGSEQWLVPSDSSLAFLAEGQEITLHDLICGMLLASGNDAAYTTAVSIAHKQSGDYYMADDAAVSSFCTLMNSFAAEIGMNSSNFATPDGWDNDMTYTTVRDLLTLSEYVLTVPELADIVGTQQYSTNFVTGDAATWTNSNRLLDPEDTFYCPTAIGMKTGSTLNAGSNLISAFRENGYTYIIIVTGCGSDDDRYDLTLKLHDYFIVQ